MKLAELPKSGKKKRMGINFILVALFFKVVLHSKMPNNYCILITDFESYVFRGKIYIYILLINYFLLSINIHIVIHKGPEIEPKNNSQVTVPFLLF